MTWYIILVAAVFAILAVDGRYYVKKRGSNITIVEKLSGGEPRGGESVDKDCKCRCKKLHSNRGWECCKCAWTDEVCFPGDGHVQLESGVTISIATLQIGDMILTANEDGSPTFTEVIGFLKRHPHTDAVYSVIKTSRGSVRMTSRHIVFTSPLNNTALREPRFAQDVSIGDYLFHSNGSVIKPTKVLSIDSEIMEGVYVPLTRSGTLMVDGMLASSYSSINHHVAHAFLAPVRWFPSLFQVAKEDYGMSRYVSALKWFAHVILPSHYQGHYDKQTFPIISMKGELLLTGSTEL